MTFAKASWLACAATLALTACSAEPGDDAAFAEQAGQGPYYQLEQGPENVDYGVIERSFDSAYSIPGGITYFRVFRNIGSEYYRGPLEVEIEFYPNDLQGWADVRRMKCFLEAGVSSDAHGTWFSYTPNGCFDGMVPDPQTLDAQKTPGSMGSACTLGAVSRCNALGAMNLRIQANDASTRCTCGVDVTTALTQMAQDVRSRFDAQSKAQKDAICSGLGNAQTNGDVYNLAFARGRDSLASGTCGRYDTVCSDTVTVDGKCFLAGEVNYWLQGLSHKLCHAHTGNALYSLASMRSKITAYRSTKTPKGIEGRIAWFERGWSAMDRVRAGQSIDISALTTDSGYVYQDPDSRVRGFSTCSAASSTLLWHVSDRSLTNDPYATPTGSR